MELRAHWDKFRSAAAGSRFRDHYDRVHNQQRPSTLRTIIYYLLASLSILIGMILMIMPGPAVVFFMLAAILLSSESRSLASTLDKAEVKIRDGWSRFRR